MKLDEARLEALKLAHRPDRDTAQVIEVATVYANFLMPTAVSKPEAKATGNAE